MAKSMLAWPAMLCIVRRQAVEPVIRQVGDDNPGLILSAYAQSFLA